MKRSILVVVAGLAVGVAVVVGVLLLVGDSPSAHAAITDATERTDQFQSGRIAVLYDVRGETLGPETQSGTIDIEYRFDGDNRATVNTVNMTTDGAEPALFISEQRTVDGHEYVRSEFPDGSEMVSTGWMRTDDTPGLLPPGGPGIEFLGAAYADLGQLMALVEAAEDMSKVSSADGSTTYEGSIAPGALTELPIGIGRAASEADAARPERIPEELRLTVVVEDDMLRSVALTAVGEFLGTSFEDGVASDIEGYTDTTITTTYSEMGEPQTIEAPPADELVDGP